MSEASAVHVAMTTSLDMIALELDALAAPRTNDKYSFQTTLQIQPPVRGSQSSPLLRSIPPAFPFEEPGSDEPAIPGHRTHERPPFGIQIEGASVSSGSAV